MRQGHGGRGPPCLSRLPGILIDRNFGPGVATSRNEDAFRHRKEDYRQFTVCHLAAIRVYSNLLLLRDMAYTLVQCAPDRPDSLNGGNLHHTSDELAYIVSQFDVALPIHMRDFEQKGNINFHTYLVEAGDGREYLLQKVNSAVFTRPYRVMDSMIACIGAQRRSLEKQPRFWEPITLVPTRHGEPYQDISDSHGWSVWRLMHKIPNVVTYKSLAEVEADRRLDLAAEVGRGLALYSDLTASMPNDLLSPLPGYRNTRVYFDQFDSVLRGTRSMREAEPYLPTCPELIEATSLHYLLHVSPEDAAVRREKASTWIEFARAHRDRAMVLFNQLESGAIRRQMVHGDTKIENFLFCAQSGRVKSLIDLDTIVPSTWLADYGDMVRSLVNVAGEKEHDLSKVRVNEEVYEAVARGFLETATTATATERSLMVDAVISITLELGTRFLTDYLRGDSYFGVAPDARDLNLRRAAVQFTLASELMAHEPAAQRLLRPFLA